LATVTLMKSVSGNDASLAVPLRVVRQRIEAEPPKGVGVQVLSRWCSWSAVSRAGRY